MLTVPSCQNLTWPELFVFVKQGLFFSVQLTLVATLGGIIIGTLLALMRLSGRKVLTVPASIYVTLFRSVPLLMVILWFFLLIPSGFYYAVAGQFGEDHRKELSVLITFTVFEAAYFSEIMRAGIQSIPRGQVHAGYAVGMTYAQCMKLVVLPQAFRNMLPVLLTQTVILFQDTSLVYAIGAYDLLKGFKNAGELYGCTVMTYAMAAVVYFIICFSLSMLVRRLQKKIQIIR
jgi:glutamate/aspartate transport system permease protein